MLQIIMDLQVDRRCQFQTEALVSTLNGGIRLESHVIEEFINIIKIFYCLQSNLWQS